MDEILPQQSELQSSFDLFEVTFLLTYISQEQHKVIAWFFDLQIIDFIINSICLIFMKV